MAAFIGRPHPPRCAKASPTARCACVLALSVAVVLWAASPAAAMLIELPYVGSPLPPPVMSGLATSVSIATGTWESEFADPIVLHFKLVEASIPGGPLGYFDVDPTTSPFAYSSVAAALALDSTSAHDASAVSSLQPGPALSMITNDTAGAPSLRMHVTAPLVYNSTLRLTRANQKALGLLPGADGGLVPTARSS